MGYKKPLEHIQSDTDTTKILIEKRGHIYIEGEFSNREAVLIVWCPIHDDEHSTTFHNYNRSKVGLPCCAKQRVSEKLKNRVITEETRKKISDTIQANRAEAPSKENKDRRWRETQSYRSWRNSVLKEYNYRCALTGAQKVNQGDLVVHHLACAKKNPNLIYEVENGIVLKNCIHVKFHERYRYGRNTVEQFREFLLFLLKNQTESSTPISSQANSEGLEGSETRAYDPERVMELHERLGNLNF
jgi:hypothetical protein